MLKVGAFILNVLMDRLLSSVRGCRCFRKSLLSRDHSCPMAYSRLVVSIAMALFPSESWHAAQGSDVATRADDLSKVVSCNRHLLIRRKPEPKAESRNHDLPHIREQSIALRPMAQAKSLSNAQRFAHLMNRSTPAGQGVSASIVDCC